MYPAPTYIFLSSLKQSCENSGPDRARNLQVSQSQDLNLVLSDTRVYILYKSQCCLKWSCGDTQLRYPQATILVQNEEELLAMGCAALLAVSTLPLQVSKPGHGNVSNAIRSGSQIR